MKKEYAFVPPSMAEMETYGFSWMDFITAIPSPLFVATTWKDNGKTNACLQSWATFTGNTDGFFAILSAVYKKGHLYKTLKNTGVCALNFPSAEIYDCCIATIRHNQWEEDEITASGLTVEPGSTVHAPRIQECFLALECEYEAHMDETKRGRYGETGYLYNVHYPLNPETYAGKAHDYIAVLQKLRDMGEY